MPLEFISDRVPLLAAEIAAGYRLGYLDDSMVVKLAEGAVTKGQPVLPAVEELALLLTSDLDRVPELVTEVEAQTGATDSQPWRPWLFLVLAWTYEHREQSSDPMADLEAVYADFDYPQEMEGFVPFLPAPPGQGSGREAVEERWHAYLDERARDYAERSTGTHT